MIPGHRGTGATVLLEVSRYRQTVSAIETGERRISAEELLTAVQKLGKPLEYFTDPFLLVGEGQITKFHFPATDLDLNGSLP